MSGKTDRRITFLSLTTAALPPDGSGVAWWLAWCGGRWFSTQYEAETFAFSRIYCNIRKPLMPIRYPIAFRGTARPSVCSAWRHKVPKKSVWRIRNPISYRNSVLFRKFLLVSALFAHSETLCRAETRCFAETFLFVSALFVQVETLYRAETRCFSKTFCLFQPYLLIPKPSLFVELGAVVHQRETSARFRHQRNLQAFFVIFCLFAF